MTIQNGMSGRIICDMGTPEIPEETNRVMPTGGVLMPMARFATTTKPK